jgi:fimbrial isopeptide formation D2 family protein/LPXTG-motif cell wall-anchored protein
MKGKIRKLLSVVVATAMTLSCLSVPALAADPDSAGTSDGSSSWSEANMTIDGHTYEVYQVFIGEVGAGGTISQLQYGYNGKGTEGADVSNTDYDNFKKLSNDNGVSENERAQKIWSEWVVNNKNTPYSTYVQASISKASGSDISYTVAGITRPGYYLIKDKDNSQSSTNNSTNSTYTLYIAKTYNNILTFNPKGSYPTVSKTVSNNETVRSGDSNTASIGDELTYTVTATIPSDVMYYNTYFLRFNDTMTEGLTYQADAKIMLYTTSDTSGVDVTKYFYVTPSTETDGATLTAACEDIMLLSNLDEVTGDIDSQASFVMTYTAKLNSNAAINGGGTKGSDNKLTSVNAANTNTANLTYSNNPNNSGTPGGTAKPEEPSKDPTAPDDSATTTDAVTNTYTLKLHLVKVDSSNQATALDGAVFQLSGTGVNKVVVVEDKYFRADEDGVQAAVDAGYVTLGTGFGKADYLKTNSTRYYKTSASAADGYTTTAPTSGAAGYADSTDTIGYFRVQAISTKGTDETETSVIGYVNSNGVVEFSGLGAGNYTFKEVLAPSGYEPIDDVNFTIVFNSATNEFNISSTSSITEFVQNHESINGVMNINIKNATATALPQTGGIGTTIFYVAGTILVLGAAVALITRRRMKGEVK